MDSDSVKGARLVFSPLVAVVRNNVSHSAAEGRHNKSHDRLIRNLPITQWSRPMRLVRSTRIAVMSLAPDFRNLSSFFFLSPFP